MITTRNRAHLVYIYIYICACVCVCVQSSNRGNNQLTLKRLCRPICLAMRQKNCSKAAEVGLDVVQKLVAHGIVRGDCGKTRKSENDTVILIAESELSKQVGLGETASQSANQEKHNDQGVTSDSEDDVAVNIIWDCTPDIPEEIIHAIICVPEMYPGEEMLDVQVSKSRADI